MIKDRNEKQDSLILDCGGQLGTVQFTERRVCSNFFQGKKNLCHCGSLQHRCHLIHLDCLTCFDYMERYIPSHELTTVSWGSSGKLQKHAICSTLDFESVYSNIKLSLNVV